MFLKFADLRIVPPTTLPDVETTLREIAELKVYLGLLLERAFVILE